MHRILKYIFGGLGFRVPAATLLAVTGLVLNDCAHAAEEIVHNYALYYLQRASVVNEQQISQRQNEDLLNR